MLQTQNAMVWSGLLVCSRCLDLPNPQERDPRLRPDPVPIKHPRPVKDGPTIVPTNWPPPPPVAVPAPPLVLAPAPAVSGIGSLAPFIQMSVVGLTLAGGIANGGSGNLSLSISASAALSGTAAAGRTGSPATSIPGSVTFSGIAASAIPGTVVPIVSDQAFSSGFSSGFL